MSKNNIIIALVVLCLVGVIWGSVENKKSGSMERQLLAMRAETSATPATVEPGVAEEAASKAMAEIKDLKSQNKKLLTSVASLKKDLTKSQGGSQAVEAMQAEFDSKAAAVTSLEEAVVAAKTELEQKSLELAAATEAIAGLEETIAGLEDVKSTLANDVDKYNAKNQQLVTEVEACSLRLHSFNKTMEERGRLLVESGEELARTKLNMTVLLSKIAAQNNSLEILEGARAALETELAARSLIIEDLLSKRDIQVVQEIILVEEDTPAAPAEEAPAN